MKCQEIKKRLHDQESITHIVVYIEEEAFKGVRTLTLNHTSVYPNKSRAVNYVQIDMLRKEGFEVERNLTSSSYIISGWM